MTKYIKFPNKELLLPKLERAYSILIGDIKKTDKEFNFYSKVEALINVFSEHASSYPPSEEGFSEKGWKQALSDAEALVNWIKETRIVVTITKKEIDKNETYTLVQFDIPVLDRTPTQCEEFSQLAQNKKNPYWLSNLMSWQKSFWKDVAKEIGVEGINKTLFSQPSTIRKYPDLPFYMRHGILVFDKDNKLICQSIRCRSSIVAPYKLERYEKEIQRLTNQNISQLISNELPLVFVRHWKDKLAKINSKKQIVVPILYQSLLTRTRGIDADNKILDRKMEQFGLFDQFFNIWFRDDQKKIKFVTISTNYAVNFGDEKKSKKGSMVAEPVNNSEAVKLIISCVRDYLEVIYVDETTPSRPLRLLKNLLKHLSQLSDNFIDPPLKGDTFEKAITAVGDSKKWSTAEELQQQKYILKALEYYIVQQRGAATSNLLLAALENSLVTAIGGLAISSCKSGKDRNGLLQIIADALEVSFAIDQILPDLMKGSKKKKKNKEKEDGVEISYDDLIVSLFQVYRNFHFHPFLLRYAAHC